MHNVKVLLSNQTIFVIDFIKKYQPIVGLWKVSENPSIWFLIRYGDEKEVFYISHKRT